MESRDLAGLLPEITRNKNFEKKKKLRQKKKLQELRRENPRAAAKLEKRSLKRKLAAKKAALDGGNTSPKAKKVRHPKTVVANEATGRETFAKKKARELVKEKRQALKQIAAEARQKSRLSGAEAPAEGLPKPRQKKRRKDGHPADLDRLLLQRTICGKEGQDGQGASSSPLSSVRCDPTLYPSDVPFYEDYAEKAKSQAVSEDTLLQRAHEYFKSVGKREKQLNRAAVAYLRQMKAINRRGGDKDGFRYVVPNGVKAVVKMMKENEQLMGGKVRGETAEWIDGDTLPSTFGGDGVEESSEKPTRRRKRRSKTSPDFYQFQVTRQWTKNAESFLNKGRAHKSMFEVKKRQRSIRKL